MYIILTQCFPSRFGGIESLVSNLALSIGKNNKVIVFADRHHILHDTIYDTKYQERMIIRRYGGIKFFRRRKKIRSTIFGYLFRCEISPRFQKSYLEQRAST